MGKVKIVLNGAAIRALLQSEPIANAVEAAAVRMTRATGANYQPERSYTDERVVYDAVDTVNWDGKQKKKRAKTTRQKTSKSTSQRTGKKVEGYWRTGKNGKKIWVKAYQRTK